MESKGLGDSIEKVTKATGIKAATNYIFDKLGKLDTKFSLLIKILSGKFNESTSSPENILAI